MSLQHFGKAAVRGVKNYTKGYSDVQTKVRDATSNDPWGPTGQQMNEIAQMTYNQNDFVEIMEMLDKRLNDKGKNWRHVFKALTVLDYLLHNGSENVIIYFKDNLYIIKTLKEFQYVDEYSKDQGANVRQKAKDITNLLTDESRLREERKNRASMRDRMVRANGRDHGPGDEDENTSRRQLQPRKGGDDEEMRRAIEASKRSLAEEQAKKAEEADLARAIALSEEEERKRTSALEDANQRSLFDEQAQVNATTSSNNPFPLVDPQTMFPQQQLQPQFTAMMPQFTAFNPYQQQAQQEAMQAQYMQQQQEWMRQQQEAQMLQAQQEEWNRQQMLLLQQQQQQQQFQQQQAAAVAAQPLFPQPTGFGSNNPFAQTVFGQTQSPHPLPSSSNANSGIESFSLPSTFANSPGPSSLSAQSPTSLSPSPAMSRPTKSDGEHSHLANLLASREGQDTFGNVGQLRFGHTNAGRIAAQKTGHNPFAPQQPQTNEQPFFSV